MTVLRDFDKTVLRNFDKYKKVIFYGKKKSDKKEY